MSAENDPHVYHYSVATQDPTRWISRLPRPREQAVREYCKWLESRVTEEVHKADFRRICRVILGNHLDLELIFEEPDAGLFVQQGSNWVPHADDAHRNASQARSY